MRDLDSSVLRTAARVAFRHLDDCSTHERKDVLKALIEVGSDDEANGADQQLFHEEQARAAQLTLRAIIEGVGQPPAAPPLPPSSPVIPVESPSITARFRAALHAFRHGGAS